MIPDWGELRHGLFFDVAHELYKHIFMQLYTSAYFSNASSHINWNCMTLVNCLHVICLLINTFLPGIASGT